MRKLLIVLSILVLLFSVKSEAQSQLSTKHCRIEIDIPSRSLYFIENNSVLKKYPVAVGKANSQTPIGEFKVINKVINPYYSKQKIAGGSPQNPLGSRWIGFKPSYGVHGNNNPKSIGKFVSAGCIRMYDKDVKELYEKVNIGVPVIVKYEPIVVEKDIDEINPVIVVYPDYYSKVPDFLKKVEEKLAELNLTEKIERSKLNTLKKLINKEVVVFSDRWIYLINGKYITNDVILIDNTLHVNLDKICSFFNIDINDTETREVVTIFNKDIPIVENNERRYVPINVLEINLGGNHKVNQNQQTIDYGFDYFLFNNKLVKGEIISIEGDTDISIESLSNMFGQETIASQEKAKVKLNNNSLDCKTVGGKTYINLNDLLLQTNLTSNIHTKDRYIEVFSEPYITYKDIIYKGRVGANEPLVPREILAKILCECQVNATDYCGCMSQIQSLLQEEQEYYNLSRLPNCFKVIKDYYNTKIYLEKRRCLQI